MTIIIKIEKIFNSKPELIMSLIFNDLQLNTMALGGVEIGNIKAAEQASVTGIARYMKSKPVLMQIAVVVGRMVATAAEFVTSSVRSKVKLDRMIKNTTG